MIFIQNAEKWKKFNDEEKAIKDLKKRENNILKFEDDYYSAIVNDRIEKFEIYKINEEIQEKVEVRKKNINEKENKEIVIVNGKKGYYENIPQFDEFGNFESYLKVFKELKT